jgi:hypothetical protein
MTVFADVAVRKNPQVASADPPLLTGSSFQKVRVINGYKALREMGNEK